MPAGALETTENEALKDSCIGDLVKVSLSGCTGAIHEVLQRKLEPNTRHALFFSLLCYPDIVGIRLGAFAPTLRDP